MKKFFLTTAVLFILVQSLFALQAGLIFNGDMQGDNNSYVGFIARSNFGLGGLEIARDAESGTDVDFTSYRFIISPSIGWGTPELRIFAGITPHIEINEGQFEVSPTPVGYRCWLYICRCGEHHRFF